MARTTGRGRCRNGPSTYVSAYAACIPGRTGRKPGPTTCTWWIHSETADKLRITTGEHRTAVRLFGPDALYQCDGEDSERFLSFVNAWLKLTAVMNELCRSMGQADFYPFVLPRAAVAKLHFVHMVVSDVDR